MLGWALLSFSSKQMEKNVKHLIQIHPKINKERTLYQLCFLPLWNLNVSMDE